MDTTGLTTSFNLSKSEGFCFKMANYVFPADRFTLGITTHCCYLSHSTKNHSYVYSRTPILANLTYLPGILSIQNSETIFKFSEWNIETGCKF